MRTQAHTYKNITPLSSLISSSTISHLLYADDTQLFIPFTPKNFSLAISKLQSTFLLFLSWTSSNYLTLNPSKTEFLLIGLPQQTSNIINPSLYLLTAWPILPSPSAKKNLDFIFNSTLSFPKQISFLSTSCHYFVTITVISDTPSISLPPPPWLSILFNHD